MKDVSLYYNSPASTPRGAYRVGPLYIRVEPLCAVRVAQDSAVAAHRQPYRRRCVPRHRPCGTGTCRGLKASARTNSVVSSADFQPRTVSLQTVVSRSTHDETEAARMPEGNATAKQSSDEDKERGTCRWITTGMDRMAVHPGRHSNTL